MILAMPVCALHRRHCRHIWIAHLAHAGPCLAPTSIPLGLARFSALGHLDMQSVCGEAPLEFEGKLYPGLDRNLTRLALQPAAVKQLGVLAGILQTLRVVYYEDVPDSKVTF